MTVRRIVPDIAAENPAIGQDFYTEVLGLEVAIDLGWVVTFASPDNATAQITVVAAVPGVAQPDYSVEVSDVDECHRRAVAQGLAIVYPLTTEAWQVRRFFVRDPHGKIANILSHAAPTERRDGR